MKRKIDDRYLLKVAYALGQQLIEQPIKCACGAVPETRDGKPGFDHLPGCTHQGFSSEGVLIQVIPD